MIKDSLQDILATLTPREEKVIKMRFAIAPYTEKLTLAKVGEHFGCTGQYIRQIQLRAIRKLRHPSRALRLITLNGQPSELYDDVFDFASHWRPDPEIQQLRELQLRRLSGEE